MWYARENTGLLETLDSENKPLVTGREYLLEGRKVRIIKEWVCEGGITPEPFTTIFYEINGIEKRLEVDSEWKFNASGVKIPYYPSPFKTTPKAMELCKKLAKEYFHASFQSAWGRLKERSLVLKS